MLRGYDQVINLILDECHERVYSSKVGQASCSRQQRMESLPAAGAQGGEGAMPYAASVSQPAAPRVPSRRLESNN